MHWGVGSFRFSGKKRYEGVWFNAIGLTRGWVGVQYPGTVKRGEIDARGEIDNLLN